MVAHWFAEEMTPQKAQTRNMSIGEHRHCCVTFEIQVFVWEKNLSFPPGGGGTPLQVANRDVPPDGVAFSRLDQEPIKWNLHLPYKPDTQATTSPWSQPFPE